MTQEVTRHDEHSAAILERVLLGGDLSGLTSDERLRYYRAVCESQGLNPLTKPFDYLLLDDKNGSKLVLYAKRDCTDQLRKIHDVTVKIVGREVVGEIYTVTALAKLPSGREDESVGAVPLAREGGEWKTNDKTGKRWFQSNGTFISLSPDAKANAIMKAETKAKRRVTLSICGLGLLDESELDTLAGQYSEPQPAKEEPPAAKPCDPNGRGVAPNPEPPKPWCTRKEMENVFAGLQYEMELRGIPFAYGATLRDFGVSEAAKFSDSVNALACYRSLKEQLQKSGAAT